MTVKTNEMIVCLEHTIRILKAFPDMELAEALEQVNLAVKEYTPKVKGKRAKEQQQSEITDAMVRDMAKMPAAELERYLRGTAEFSTKAGLHRLAKRLGTTSSPRQNFDALLNMVLKHNEALRMDVMIRTQSAHPNEEPEFPRR
jgi:hypothetical protein